MISAGISTPLTVLPDDPLTAWFQIASRAEDLTTPGGTANIPVWAGIIAGHAERVATQYEGDIHLISPLEEDRILALRRRARLLREQAQGLRAKSESELLEAVYRTAQDRPFLVEVGKATPEGHRTSLAVESVRLSAHVAGALGLFPTPGEIRRLEAWEKPLEGQERSLWDQWTDVSKGRPGERSLERATRIRSHLQERETVRSELASLRTLMNQRIRLLLSRRLREMDTWLQEGEYDRWMSFKMAPRLIRYVHHCQRRLEDIDYKIRSHLDLTPAEILFLKKASAAIAKTDEAHGRDRTLEHLDYYFRVRNEGATIRRRVDEVSHQYHRFLQDWIEHRRKEWEAHSGDPEWVASQPLHISESPEYVRLRREYTLALETLLHFSGAIPKHWQGEIFPDIEYRREGDALLIHPVGWMPNQRRLSRPAYWKLMVNDTALGFPRLVGRVDKAFGKSFVDEHYLALYMGWGQHTWVDTWTQIKLVGTHHLMPLGNELPFLLPTHDGRLEDSTLPAVLFELGIPATFLADKKFYDLTFEPPLFGLGRIVLGRMRRHGHIRINPTNPRESLSVMQGLPGQMRKNRRAVIIFPEGAINPARRKRRRGWLAMASLVDRRIHRQDSEVFYSAMPGVVFSLQQADVPLVPIALRSGAAIFPQQFWEDMGRGIGTGLTYEIIFGPVIRRQQFVSFDGPRKPKASALGSAFVDWWNQQISSLTGRKAGPPATFPTTSYRPHPVLRWFARQWNHSPVHRVFRIRLPKS